MAKLRSKGIMGRYTDWAVREHLAGKRVLGVLAAGGVFISLPLGIAARAATGQGPASPSPPGGRRPRATSHEEYLSALAHDQRLALEHLSQVIRAAAPRAEACVSYGLPAFRLDGRLLLYLSATPRHCTFYPGSSTAVEAYKEALTGYSTSKGTIRFSPDRRLPDDLVRTLVVHRVAENAGNEPGAGLGSQRQC